MRASLLGALLPQLSSNQARVRKKTLMYCCNNDQLGKKLRVKCNDDDTIRHLKKLDTGEGDHGVPNSGSKFVNMIPLLMIMNANSGSHRYSAPAPDNAESQHTASLQQVIVAILGLAAVLCFA
ncbi:hypothetical protein Tco_0316583 [Tanacetum coccineum]